MQLKLRLVGWCVTAVAAIGAMPSGGIRVACGADVGEAAPGAKDRRPNIVFLYADDLGYGDLSCYGNKVSQTPHLDTLATQGTVFKQFYVSHCVCSPTRAAALTGQFPGRHGIFGHLAQLQANAKRGMPNYLAGDAPSLPRALQQSGYSTGMIGKWHLGGGSGRVFRNAPINDINAPQVASYGFDHVRATFGNSPTWREAEPVDEPHDIYPYEDKGWMRWSSRAIADETIRFLDAQVKERPDQPFYVNVWFKDPHTPFDPTEEMLEPFKHLKEPSRTHYAMIHSMDQHIGRILDHLDKQGLAENTIVLFTSDNGATKPGGGSNGALRGWKHGIFEGGIREPFIVRWPGHVPAGRVDTTSVMNLVDFTPTLCNVAAASMPEGYQPDGEDVIAAWLGEAYTREKPMYWHHLSVTQSPPLAMRDGEWKLLSRVDGKQVWLYNVVDDVSETTDRAEQHPEIVARMKSQLLAWYDDIKPATPRAVSAKERPASSK